ncbi:MAG TPA: hypothetical protein VGM88_24360 [Kofleriaceae bacterium]|jgi:hypothetical protein
MRFALLVATAAALAGMQSRARSAPAARLDEQPTADPTAADEPFREAVRAYATKTHRAVGAWGTVLLDGKTPHRWAALRAVGDHLDPLPGAGTSGAYVIEEAPDRYSLLTYWWTEPGFHADFALGSDPPWLVLPDHQILHAQLHNHGKTYIAFGLRDGALRVLAWSDYNSRIEPDGVTHVYATASPRGATPIFPGTAQYGECPHGCPTLAHAHTRGAELHASAPATSIAALVEPPELE